MIKKISFRAAVKLMLASTTVLILFHLLIFFGVIPYDMVWGGRLKTEAQMQQFEMVSLAINLLILLVISIKGQYIKVSIPKIIPTVFMWAFVILFSLNTVGNILSANLFEAIVFTPLALIFAVLSWRIAVEK